MLFSSSNLNSSRASWSKSRSHLPMVLLSAPLDNYQPDSAPPTLDQGPFTIHLFLAGRSPRFVQVVAVRFPTIWRRQTHDETPRDPARPAQ